jgi:hypothetical protein
MTKIHKTRSQAVADDALDDLIRDLTEEALLSGGFVVSFGPAGEGDGAGRAQPPGHRR